jgi:pyridoxal phosphate enzyme (YggS family)
MSVEDNLRHVQSLINGRARLVAITKTQPLERVKELHRLGVNCFGESRIQEAETKVPHIKAEWHLIGHLQSNKAKRAVELFEVIQTLDSLKLANRLDKFARKKEKIQKVMIQVNIAQNPDRYGINPEETLHLAQELQRFKNLKLIGLMAMAPLIVPEKTRPYFRAMKAMFDVVNKYTKIEYLSLGMSTDFVQAIEEGGNMVRIGAILFS